MKVLNLLSSGGVGGIEKLCEDIGLYSEFENCFCFLFSEGIMYDEMKEKGLCVVSLANCGSKKSLFKRMKRLVKLAKNYDVINVHHSALAIQLVYYLLKIRLPKKKFVLTAHSCFDSKDYYNYGSNLKNWLRKYLLKKVLKKSDSIVFVSEAGKKSYLKAFKIDESKTTVIYNGVRLSSDMLNSQMVKTVNTPYNLTYIGRLVKAKGVQNLIQAIKILDEDKQYVQVKIVGDGNYRGELEKLVKEEKVEHLIKFEGQQRDIKKYLLETDIFIYPSIWEEVFGISIVEAMAYAVPCVAYSVGGIPEIIIDGVNGTLAENKTPLCLKEAIQRVIGYYEKGEIDKIKSNCISTAKKFDIITTVNKMKINYELLFGDN